MVLTTTVVNGRVPLPDDANPANAEVIFTLTGVDTDSATIIPEPVKVVPDVGGNITVNLWPNTRGLRGTQYAVSIQFDEAWDFRRYDLEKITVSEVGPLNLEDILALAAPASLTDAQIAVAGAEAARDATIALYDQFDDRYLGVKAADPILDNDGDALVVGAIYINSGSGLWRGWTGALWINITYVANAVAITGGAIDGTVVGGVTPALGSFTSLNATGVTIIDTGNVIGANTPLTIKSNNEAAITSYGWDNLTSNYDYVFNINGAARARFDPNGAFLIGTAIAGSAGTGDLVVNGGIFLGGSAALNELSDIEESTWALALIGATTATISLTRKSTYRRVGNKVTCFIDLQLNANSDTGGFVFDVPLSASADVDASCGAHPRFDSSVTVGSNIVAVLNGAGGFSLVNLTGSPRSFQDFSGKRIGVTVTYFI